jgi:hypothetical protein
MKIELANFAGMAPDQNDKLLASNFGVECVNCFTDSGVIDTYYEPTYVMTIGKLGKITSLYKLDNANIWLHWTQTNAPYGVSVARVPIAYNQYDRVVFTGMDKPRYTDDNYASSGGGGGTAWPYNSWWLGIPVPTNAPSVVVSSTPAVGIQIQYQVSGTVSNSAGGSLARSYVFTYVTADGTEGPPSPPSDIAYSNEFQQTAVSITLGADLTGPMHITNIRLYRSLGSGTFLYVDEFAVNETTYIDTKKDTELGATLQSTTWSPPPDNLLGVTVMTNGILAGFVENSIYFSEPYQCQGWPEDYILTLDYVIVGMSSSQNMLYVSTTGYPYVVVGTTPSSMQEYKLETTPANMSLRSLVDIGGGVMYASNDGLVMMTNSQASVVTAQVISERVWQLMNPSSIHGYFYRNKYFGFYDTGNTGNITPVTGETFPAKGGFIFDPTRNALTFTDVYCDAAFNDKTTATLYMVQNINGVNQLMAWDGGTQWEIEPQLIPLRWMTKTIVTPNCNLAAARVDCKVYPVTFQLYANGVLKHTSLVSDQNPFRLPGGYRARQWRAYVTGNAIVQGIFLATSIDELRS